MKFNSLFSCSGFENTANVEYTQNFLSKNVEFRILLRSITNDFNISSDYLQINANILVQKEQNGVIETLRDLRVQQNVDYRIDIDYTINDTIDELVYEVC